MTYRMELRSPLPRPVDHLDALVLCQSPAMAIRPVQTIKSLICRFWGDLDIQTSIWSFEDLSAPASFDAAGHAAAGASLIAVATRGHGDLPMLVQELLTEALVTRLAFPTALLHFEESTPGNENSKAGTETYLRHLALTTGAAYFTTKQPGRLDPMNVVSGFGGPEAPRWPRVPAGVHHWGLNE